MFISYTVCYVQTDGVGYFSYMYRVASLLRNKTNAFLSFHLLECFKILNTKRKPYLDTYIYHLKVKFQWNSSESILALEV